MDCYDKSYQLYITLHAVLLEVDGIVLDCYAMLAQTVLPNTGSWDTVAAYQRW